VSAFLYFFILSRHRNLPIHYGFGSSNYFSLNYPK
jgi:hypothetical protein